MKKFIGILGLVLGLVAQAGNPAAIKNIVIVHGAFADGSGWESVYRILTNDGYNVAIVQNPLVSLTADVAATENVLANQNGPVVLVGHSYGGAVITEAGNDPKVRSLVYVAALMPDAGESVASLIGKPDPNASPSPILPPQNGFLFVDKLKFPGSFAGDVDLEKAKFMAASQAPLGVEAFTGRITKAAWKTKPSSYILTTEDKMVPLEAQRGMATRAKAAQFEIKASHAVFISQPEEVAKVIERAANR